MQFITCNYSEQNWLFKIIYLLNQYGKSVFRIIFKQIKKIFLTLIAADFYSQHGSLDLMWI